MGTRSITVIQEDGEPITVLYRQMDGYPTGHGKELKDFAEGFTIVNGIGSDCPEKAANGMGCFAAQLVAHFKESIGGFYLYPPSVTDAGQDYTYVIDMHPDNHRLVLTVIGYRGTVRYAGYLDNFDPEKVEESEEDAIIMEPFTVDQLKTKGKASKSKAVSLSNAPAYLSELSKKYRG